MGILWFGGTIMSCEPLRQAKSAHKQAARKYAWLTLAAQQKQLPWRSLQWDLSVFSPKYCPKITLQLDIPRFQQQKVSTYF